LGFDFVNTALQLDELRLAVRSPVRRTDEDKHRPLRPHDGLKISGPAVLILEVEIGYPFAYLRSESRDINPRPLDPVCRLLSRGDTDAQDGGYDQAD